MRSKSEDDVPAGFLHGTFAELHAAGCIQTGCDKCPDIDDARREFGNYFTVLSLASAATNLCDGCPHYRGGLCPAFQKFHTGAAVVVQRKREQQTNEQATAPPGTKLYPGMSVRDIAKELGVSLSEVRRRKQAGLI